MTPSQIGSDPHRPLRVAVVGAGPSGFYAVAALLDAPGLHVSVDVFDRLPAPFGLVRYGVAPDHEKIKRVDRVFDKTARDPRVRYYGNVALGRDVSRRELLDLYDAVIYAVGAQSDRRLGIPGEDLDGSWSSTEFVAWYNGHPDFAAAEYPLRHRQVAVVGIGNVAMDCARLLARPAEDLATTDISDTALEAFRHSRVEDVHVLARRGPAQAACTPPELKELGELEGVDVIVDPAELDDVEMAGEADRQTKKNLELFREFAEGGERPPGGDARRRIHFHFLVSPVEIRGEEGRVAGLVVEKNELVERDGRLRPRGTGERRELPVSAVIRAIGYRSVPLPDVPFDDAWGIIPNRDGRVTAWRDGTREGEAPVQPREYVVGWAKRGPSGLIGTNKADSNDTVARLLEDAGEWADPGAGGGEIGSGEAGDDGGAAAIEDLLRRRGIRWVDYEGWQAIERLETERGAEAGRPRAKICHLDELLEASGAGEVPARAESA